MSEWKEVKIGNIANLYQGLAINAKTNYLIVEKSTLPLLRIKDLQENNQELFVNDTEVPNKCIANEDDLIFTRTGIVGLVFMGKKGVVHNNCFRIVPKIDKMYLPFYYYYFNRKNMRDYLTGLSAGSVQPDMNHSIFKTIKVPYPPLPEQKAIAEVLSSLDDKIDLLHRQNKTLEQMAETLFRQWVVEEAGEDWWKSIDEIEIEIIDGNRGKNYPKNEELLEEGYCLFLSAKNVTMNGFDISQKQFISKEKDSLLRKGKLQRGDIILTTRGTVGNFFFYDQTIPFENIRINSGMIILRSSKFDPILFYNIFKSSFFKKTLFEFTSGSAQPQIPIRDFKNINIPFPATDIIQEYLTIINPIYHKKVKNDNQIRTLDKLRDTILPKLMSGEVRVKI